MRDEYRYPRFHPSCGASVRRASAAFGILPLPSGQYKDDNGVTGPDGGRSEAVVSRSLTKPRITGFSLGIVCSVLFSSALSLSDTADNYSHRLCFCQIFSLSQKRRMASGALRSVHICASDHSTGNSCRFSGRPNRSSSSRMTPTSSVVRITRPAAC